MLRHHFFACGLGLVCIGAADGQPSDQEKTHQQNAKALVPFKEPLDRIQRAVGQPCVSVVNGVKLELSAKVKPDGKGLVIELSWTLTNIAARSPLVIVRPSIDVPNSGTIVMLYLVPDGKDYSYGTSFVSPHEDLKPDPDPFGLALGLPKTRIEKQWYLSVPFRKSAKGTFAISANQFKDSCQKVERGRLQAPKLFVELCHCPFARGEELDLDAWTGSLGLPPVEVTSGDPP
jgi:hypothetical protein